MCSILFNLYQTAWILIANQLFVFLHRRKAPKKISCQIRLNGPYVLSGGPLIFNVILFKRKAVYTEGAGPVCKCTGQCTLEGCILLF